MDHLALVLCVKIIITLLFWCLPLLTFPASCFERMGMPEPRPMLFMRLLGAAFLALVVGYFLGLQELKQGNDVQNVVWVGIVSNGSASLILFFYGIRGAWEAWSILARGMMWASAFVTALITSALIITGL